MSYQKFLLCVSSHGQDLYSHQKLNMYICWFSSESGNRRRRRQRRIPQSQYEYNHYRATDRLQRSRQTALCLEHVTGYIIVASNAKLSARWRTTLSQPHGSSSVNVNGVQFTPLKLFRRVGATSVESATVGDSFEFCCQRGKSRTMTS